MVRTEVLNVEHIFLDGVSLSTVLSSRRLEEGPPASAHLELENRVLSLEQEIKSVHLQHAHELELLRAELAALREDIRK